MATLFPSVLPTPIQATALRSSFEIDYNATAQTFSVTIPPYTYIEYVETNVTTTFSPATPTLIVGDVGSATQFLNNTTTFSVTGATQSAYSVRKLYTAANTLYFNWYPQASGTQGVLYGYIAYHYLPGSAASGAMMAGYQ